VHPEAIGFDGVSRETLQKLRAFEELVQKWSPRINIVSRHDLPHLFERHILDSAQLVALSDRPEHWMDLGSGGGFPGIVVAILLSEARPASRVTLVESDKRKCAFLAAAKRQLELSVEIIPRRIEDLEPMGATTMSARALARLDRLIELASRHIADDGVALFLKGKDWKNELVEAKRKWSFDCDVVESITDPKAAVLRIRNILRR